MKWEKIVEIQYDAMQRTSALFIAILGAIVIFVDKTNINWCANFSLIVSFFLVILQNISVLYLTNIQREASWKKETHQDPTKENKKELCIRFVVLLISALSAISIVITIAFISFSSKN